MGEYVEVHTRQEKLAPFSLPGPTAATKSSLQHGTPIALDEDFKAVEIAEHRIKCRHAFDHDRLGVSNVPSTLGSGKRIPVKWIIATSPGRC